MKTKIILIEGPDCAGKSTLVKQMIKILGKKNVAKLHGRVFKNCYKSHYDMIRYAQNCGKKYAIIDRHWLSEVIYGEIFRGGAQKEYYDKDRIKRTLISKIDETIICLPEKWTFKKELKNRKEQYTNIKKMKKVYNMYRIFSQQFSCLVYDYNIMEAKDAIRYVKTKK